jgi:transcriptional regulator
MYVPKHFEETRPEEIRRLLRAFPLGMLVTHGADGLDAQHLPFEFDAGEGLPTRLSGHVARANPVWQSVRDGDEVLVVFRGDEAYVSPNWYPSKHEEHRQVPTWNYQVVHVHGRIHLRHDETFLRGLLARLTRTHEANAGQSPPWRMTDSAPDYIATLLKQIVGLEVRVERIEAKSKLSQNKDARDRESVIAAMDAQGAEGVAEAMRRAHARGEA